MLQSKTPILIIVTLVIGILVGFLARPVVAPPVHVGPKPALTTAEARGIQYFVAHVDEARGIVAGCRDGSVRGGECANAEEAVIKVEAQGRRKRFLGN